MFSSTKPSAERPDWHPVHRANALLRWALLNTSAPSAAPLQELSRINLDAPWGGIEPGAISHPGSLTERLSALSIREEALAGSRHEPRAAPELRPDALDIRLHDLAADVWDNGDENRDVEVFAADVQFDSTARVVAPQAHVEALVHEFYRRQRRATLLVAGSLVAAVVLTFGGFLLVGSLVAHGVKSGDSRPLPHSTSVAWQRPLGFAPAQLRLVSVGANRTAQADPSLFRPWLTSKRLRSARHHRVLRSSSPQAGGRALGPLLPPSHARYLFRTSRRG
jgi:hypothetical protein